MPQNLRDDKLSLVRVMSWYRKQQAIAKANADQVP